MVAVSLGELASSGSMGEGMGGMFKSSKSSSKKKGMSLGMKSKKTKERTSRGLSTNNHSDLHNDCVFRRS